MKLCSHTNVFRNGFFFFASTTEEATSPIVKVATWIKQKATTFGENYFYRPVDMQNGYENHTSVTQEPVQENPEQVKYLLF